MVCANNSDEGMTNDLPPFVKIGQRVECNGSYGTVLYIGEVPPTEGIWLGIDWDDPNRGKHNGSHEGVTYFKARHSTSGSFVRLSKVHFGVDCVTAIQNRYGEVKDDETAGIDKQAMAIAQKEMNAPFFEVVGFSDVNKMQSDFGNLLVVFLKEHYVNNAGPAGGLHNLCPKLLELDISKNLLNSWEAVSEITQQLPEVRFLNVSENRLTVPTDPSILQESFKSIEHVVLGTMEYTWSDVLTCSEMWPHVQNLQLQFNRITSLSTPPNTLSDLKNLDLEGNSIQSWNEILMLGKLPRLEILNLTNTELTKIQFPADKTNEETVLFPALKQLYLSENKIDQWESVNELHKLKSLEELRFLLNPLHLQVSLETCRELVIAKLPNLKKLNGVVITRGERKGAEYDYLKMFGQAWLDINRRDDREMYLQEFLLSHPQYPSLIQKFGSIEEEEVKVWSSVLKTKLINVEILSPKVPGKVFKKKLPLNMSVHKLLGMAAKLFNTGTEVPTLKYISSKNSTVQFSLDNNMKEINYYSIEDGDTIVVNWN